jgi:hypothetical protein
MVSSRHDPIRVANSYPTAIADGTVEHRVQSLAARAPEVWQGFPCRHASDVWSLAATVSFHLPTFEKYKG